VPLRRYLNGDSDHLGTNPGDTHRKVRRPHKFFLLNKTWERSLTR
jgi:hypothetical protein